jgi:hypothetical protein
MNIEETKSRIIEEIETTLFFDNYILNTIYEVFEELEKIDFQEFKQIFYSKIDFDYNDILKWFLIKEYTTIENLKTVDFETIEKDFFEDIKKCFDIVGV